MIDASCHTQPLFLIASSSGKNLESGEPRDNMRVTLSDERRKTLDLIVIFLKCNLRFPSERER